MNKTQRNQNRANALRLYILRKEQNPRPNEICSNCGEPGPHFAPPCFGEEGFFMCSPKGIKKGELFVISAGIGTGRSTYDGQASGVPAIEQ